MEKCIRKGTTEEFWKSSENIKFSSNFKKYKFIEKNSMLIIKLVCKKVSGHM